MIKLKNYVRKYREAVNDNGFSLLELVVAVGILLVLTVGGLLAYNGITKNARVAAVQSAASEVYTGAVAYDSNGEDFKKADVEWNGSSKKKDGKASIEVSSSKTDGKICSTAVMEAYDIAVNRGAGCVSEGVVVPGDDDNNPGGNGGTNKSKVATIAFDFMWFDDENPKTVLIEDKSGKTLWSGSVNQLTSFEIEYTGNDWKTLNGKDMPDLIWSSSYQNVSKKSMIIDCDTPSEDDESIQYYCFFDGELDE